MPENSVGRKSAFAFLRRKTVVGNVVQGVLVGFAIAVITIIVLFLWQWGAIQTNVNSWTTTLKCGVPGDDVLVQAVCADFLPAVNLPQEEVYWTTTKDGAGNRLNGQHDYKLHFPPGDLPPNNATWSITMTDPQARFVNNSINRYNVGGLTGLVLNADGSVDIYIQNTPPVGNESNWLPAPAGNFKLWLRVYEPGAAILNGTYQVPPVVEVT